MPPCRDCFYVSHATLAAGRLGVGFNDLSCTIQFQHLGKVVSKESSNSRYAFSQRVFSIRSIRPEKKSLRSEMPCGKQNAIVGYEGKRREIKEDFRRIDARRNEQLKSNQMTDHNTNPGPLPKKVDESSYVAFRKQVDEYRQLSAFGKVRNSHKQIRIDSEWFPALMKLDAFELLFSIVLFHFV